MKEIVVFTDGSSRGNPGPGGWGSIILTPNNVYELGGYDQKTTNNRMEMMAILQTLQFLKDHEQTDQTVIINTDSQYTKNGMEKWIYGWQKKGWKTSKGDNVLNQDLWEVLAELQQLFSNLRLHYVRGHVGITGNERADAIATNFADQNSIDLYQGSRQKYPFDLNPKTDKFNVRVNKTVSNRTKKTGKAFCYLSMVDGVIKQHDQWDDCQSRVRGKSQAKYRRADSSAERDQIIKDWQR